MIRPRDGYERLDRRVSVADTLVNMTHPIRQFRVEKSLTLEAFAALVGVKKSAVSKWEHGLGPSLDLARHIEKQVGIPKERLRPDIWTREAAE